MGGSRYVFLGVLFAAELAHAQDAKPKTAVMPLQPKRVDAVTAEMLDDMLARAIEGSGCCQVMSVQDVNAMLGFEKARDAVGCDDLTCAVDLGGALGVDYFVAGSVGRLGGEFLVQLKLFNVIQSKVVGRGDSTVQDDEKLYRRAIEMAVASMLGVKTPQSPAASPGAGSVAKLPRLRFYARDASYLFDVEFTAGDGHAYRCEQPVNASRTCVIERVPAGRGMLAVSGAGVNAFRDAFRVKEQDDLLDFQLKTRRSTASVVVISAGGAVMLGGLALVVASFPRPSVTALDAQEETDRGSQLGGLALLLAGAGLAGWGFFMAPDVDVDYPGIDFLRKR